MFVQTLVVCSNKPFLIHNDYLSEAAQSSVWLSSRTHMIIFGADMPDFAAARDTYDLLKIQQTYEWDEETTVDQNQWKCFHGIGRKVIADVNLFYM